MPELSTLPRLLLRNAKDFARRTAIREKDRGIWQSYTWVDYLTHVRDFGLGLARACAQVHQVARAQNSDPIGDSGHRSQIVRGDRGEGSVEGADRGAGGTCDDDGIGHG